MNLPNSSEPNGFQKILSVGLMGAVAFGGVMLFQAIAPFLIDLFQNIIMLALLGAIIGLPTLYLVFNPLVVWGFFKTLSMKLTAFLIKMDPLSVMDRYLDVLKENKANLERVEAVVSGKEIKISRKIKELNDGIADAKKYAQAALANQDEEQAGVYGSRYSALKESINMLTPMHNELKDNLNFLNKLSKNWGVAITKIGDQIAIKRDLYETLKETVGALRSTEDFINSDTEQGRLFGMSLKAFEDSVTSKMGYIAEFEKKANPILKKIELERTADSQQGLLELKQMFSDDLFLPTSFKDEPVKIGNIQTNKQNKFNF